MFLVYWDDCFSTITCHQRAVGAHQSHYSIITVVSFRTFLVIFAILCVPMVLWVVGMGLNLPDFSCKTIWYAILATRGLWEVIRVIILSLQWWTCEHFWWFLQFCASQWYFRWLEWVSTFTIFPAEQFGMQYLPPGVYGRPPEQNTYPDYYTQMAKNRALFGGYLLFHCLLDPWHGLMGPCWNRWSIRSNLGYYLAQVVIQYFFSGSKT